MVKYCIKRILLSLLILFGVSLILYMLVWNMPADYLEQQAIAMAGSTGNYEELLANLRSYYGMDGTMMEGYWSWLSKFLSGDLGVSFKYSRPVEDVIFENMGVSFTLSFIALILELVIAIPLGIKCACNQYGKLDYIATVLTMIGISFPTFFLGSIVIKFFALDLGWLPVGGLPADPGPGDSRFMWFLDTVKHLILPMVVLVVLNIGAWMRYTRTNTLEVLNADYIRTARAKGLSEHSVVYKHVFRNTLIPLVTLLAGTLPSLFGGAMITETVFDIPGIGNTAYQAMLAGDIPFIMGYNMFIAFLTVIGILITDIMYAIVDPRVKLA
ncbi:MAG: ABC transporter permease [Clostridia bacterium]|nr:ABC transporter permease [Clostridia bacterium]